MEYEIRTGGLGRIESGDMVGIDFLDNSAGPEVWELVSTLPSGNYEIALNAYTEEFVCGGAGTFSVPSNGVSEFGILLDCRMQPSRPPGNGGVYIIGMLATATPQ